MKLVRLSCSASRLEIGQVIDLARPAMSARSAVERVSGIDRQRLVADVAVLATYWPPTP